MAFAGKIYTKTSKSHWKSGFNRCLKQGKPKYLTNTPQDDLNTF